MPGILDEVLSRVIDKALEWIYVQSAEARGLRRWWVPGLAGSVLAGTVAVILVLVPASPVGQTARSHGPIILMGSVVLLATSGVLRRHQRPRVRSADRVSIAVARFLAAHRGARDEGKRIRHEIIREFNRRSKDGVPIEVIRVNMPITEEPTETDRITVARRIGRLPRFRGHIVVWGDVRLEQERTCVDVRVTAADAQSHSGDRPVEDVCCPLDLDPAYGTLVDRVLAHIAESFLNELPERVLALLEGAHGVPCALLRARAMLHVATARADVTALSTAVTHADDVGVSEAVIDPGSVPTALHGLPWCAAALDYVGAAIVLARTEQLNASIKRLRSVLDILRGLGQHCLQRSPDARLTAAAQKVAAASSLAVRAYGIEQQITAASALVDAAHELDRLLSETEPGPVSSRAAVSAAVDLACAIAAPDSQVRNWGDAGRTAAEKAPRPGRDDSTALLWLPEWLEQPDKDFIRHALQSLLPQPSPTLAQVTALRDARAERRTRGCDVSSLVERWCSLAESTPHADFHIGYQLAAAASRALLLLQDLEQTADEETPRREVTYSQLLKLLAFPDRPIAVTLPLRRALEARLYATAAAREQMLRSARGVLARKYASEILTTYNKLLALPGALADQHFKQGWCDRLYRAGAVLTDYYGLLPNDLQSRTRAEHLAVCELVIGALEAAAEQEGPPWQLTGVMLISAKPLFVDWVYAHDPAEESICLERLELLVRRWKERTRAYWDHQRSVGGTAANSVDRIASADEGTLWPELDRLSDVVRWQIRSWDRSGRAWT